MKIDVNAPMREVLEVFPGAQRALFRRYHIGGCSSCAFSPDETLAQVCARNGGLDVAEVLGHIRSSHDQELGAYAYEKLAGLKNIRLFGPHIGRAGLVSFLLKDVHAHDVVTVADQRGVALRGGHHCNQPLMHKLGVESTARASFYFYNTTDEIDQFVEVIREIQKFFEA